MARLRELIGLVFGRLTVIERAGSNEYKKALWRCRCECGNESVHIGSGLLSGKTTSCGCYRASGQARVTHGHKRASGASKAYRTWSNMIDRCTRASAHQWKDYGGRGITVCKRWLKFENFLSDMGEPPEGMTLDRVNNNRGYSRQNCAWRDRVTQRRNSRAGMIWLEIDGERMILRDAVARVRMVSFGAAMSRIHRGWDPLSAVLTPYTRSDNKGFRETPK